MSSPLWGNLSLATAFAKLCLFFSLGLCRPEVSWWSVSDLILELIHSLIVIIDLIPRFRHLCFLQTFLAPSETTVTVMVATIIMMMMSRASDVRNTGSRWELATMRLSVETLNLSQCPPLPVAHHSFSSLLISERIVAKSLYRGLVSGRFWLEVWERFPSALSLHNRVYGWSMPSALDTKSKSYHLLSWCWPLHILVPTFSTPLSLLRIGAVSQGVSYPGPCLFLCLCLFLFLEVTT